MFKIIFDGVKFVVILIYFVLNEIEMTWLTSRKENGALTFLMENL